MMGNWGYSSNAANFGYGMNAYGFFAILFWLIVFIDLILFGIWMWKQIQKK